ncbi:MAG: hypothetical protein OHK0013_07720 [Sandaracinaceae bacterium]
MTTTAALRARLATTPGRWLVVVLRLVVAAIFLFAAAPKLLDPVAFARDIDNYRMVPDGLIGSLAITLPVVEILVGLALVTGILARGAAVVAGAMLVAFAAGMVQAILRGIDLDCGCFGQLAEAHVTWWSVARNVMLLAFTVVVALGPDQPFWPLSSFRRGGR